VPSSDAPDPITRLVAAMDRQSQSFDRLTEGLIRLAESNEALAATFLSEIDAAEGDPPSVYLDGSKVQQ